ncbi:MAG: magnesium transporter CorA family protein [Leptospiraceae bacterium]|nr:magnesium transporter CorA family protein [Leptospiraceae bacterium]
MGNFVLTQTRKVKLSEKDFPLKIYPDNSKIWVHLEPKNEAELVYMLEKYNVHPLTIEDVFSISGRVKLEKFSAYIFITLRGFHLEGRQLITKNFHFLIRKNTIITICAEYRETIHQIIENWDKRKAMMRKGLEFVLHQILDIETDNTLAIVYRIDSLFDRYEESVMEFSHESDVITVFELRLLLLNIRKVIYLQRDVLDELAKVNRKFFRGDSAAFFRDVRDHMIKILETVDSVTQSINSTLEAHLTLSSRRTNEIIRILTIMTAIMMPMTIVTGVYGMNFDWMPFLRSTAGFWISMLFMGLIATIMLMYFRVKKWL